MALPANAVIVAIQEGVRFMPSGTTLRTTIYKYTIGDYGPFTLELDPAGNTTANVEAAINQKAASIAALTGGGQ